MTLDESSGGETSFGVRSPGTVPDRAYDYSDGERRDGAVLGADSEGERDIDTQTLLGPGCQLFAEARVDACSSNFPSTCRANDGKRSVCRVCPRCRGRGLAANVVTGVILDHTG